MALREVMWRHFWDHSKWTPVHLHDASEGEVSPGRRKALCGKRFDVEDARIRGRDGDAESAFRECKSCGRIARARGAKEEKAADEPKED